MPVLANDVVEFVVKAKSANQDILNVLHYRVVNPATWPPLGVDITLTTGGAVSKWREQILPQLHTSYVVTEFLYRVIRGVIFSPGPPPETDLNVPEQFVIPGIFTDAGGGVGEPLPTFVAIGLRKLTDRPGRRFRGSMRLGPFLESETTANVLTAAKQGAINTLIPIFLADWDTGTAGQEIQWCVFSETSALEREVTTPDSRQDTADITNLLLNTFATSQVSRKQSLSAPT